MLCFVRLQQVSNPKSTKSKSVNRKNIIKINILRDKRIIWIRVREQRANGEEQLGDSQSRRPVILEDIEADSSFIIDIAVIDLGGELNLWWLEWVILWELELKEKHSSFIG
jgi:hypothetical protein